MSFHSRKSRKALSLQDSQDWDSTRKTHRTFKGPYITCRQCTFKVTKPIDFTKQQLTALLSPPPSYFHSYSSRERLSFPVRQFFLIAGDSHYFSSPGLHCLSPGLRRNGPPLPFLMARGEEEADAYSWVTVFPLSLLKIWVKWWALQIPSPQTTENRGIWVQTFFDWKKLRSLSARAVLCSPECYSADVKLKHQEDEIWDWVVFRILHSCFWKQVLPIAF